MNVSRQLVEERLGVLQDRRVEAFGEPAVAGGEKIVGFGTLALVAPEAGETGGGAQLKRFGMLVACDIERLTQTDFGLDGGLAGHHSGVGRSASGVEQQQLSFKPMQLCSPDVLFMHRRKGLA